MVVQEVLTGLLAGFLARSSHYQLGKLYRPGLLCWLDLRRRLSVSDRERPLVTGVNGPLMARQPRSASLGVLARMPVAQLDPVHETGARLFKRDRSCWKSGLRSARFTNADCRRPSAPPRKMAADPVQHSDQPVPVRMSAFLRHISIMHLLSLGYEPYDVRLPRPGRSPVAALTLANGCHASRSNLGVSRAAPHPATSRAQIRAPICLLTRGIAVRVTATVSGLSARWLTCVKPDYDACGVVREWPS